MFHSVGKNKPISEQVEDELIEAIRNREYLPGDKIPTENELCRIFNVSRTTIREAVKRMSARGIVEVKRGSGVFVSHMNYETTTEVLNMHFEFTTDNDVILQTIEARLIVEPTIAAQVAKLRTEKHIELLELNFSELKKCKLDDKKREADLDNDFHKTLLSMVNNKVLDLLLGPIYNLMPKYIVGVFAKPNGGDLLEEKNIMLSYHNRILEAIKNEDSQEAFDAMKSHITETKANYLKFKINKD
ncbi:transcriptional regulator, GntR family [Lutibacter agarilyticus]|uniref:Transcriptional regulator, GntR family n=1 Tax=Lutibacter agarilyticus TaxID=1109740 RepID=A0A238VCI8_9FLAO|nr:FadR/GntR family transcriptional regulator [Lutibacter agarilyticus]SNR31403.1 transcriptional regulator, GntR family [Lutibacter agarilyticus]